MTARGRQGGKLDPITAAENGKKGNNSLSPRRSDRDNKVVTDILQNEFNMDPARVICTKLLEMEEMFNSKKDSLSFKDCLDYYKTYIGSMERIQPYVYAKQALEFKSEKSVVKVDYNNMISQLNDKALVMEGDRIAKIDKYMEGKLSTVVSEQ